VRTKVDIYVLLRHEYGAQLTKFWLSYNLRNKYY